MENQSQREKLVFHGLLESDHETVEESESKVRRFISDELALDETRISVEQAHRLNTRKSPKPVKFSHYKDKEKVLRTYREKIKELKESQAVNGDASAQDQVPEVYVSGEREVESLLDGDRVAEDFSARVRKARASLRPFLLDFLKAKQNAFIKFDKLVVDDVTYVYDEIGKKNGQRIGIRPWPQ